MNHISVFQDIVKDPTKLQRIEKDIEFFLKTFDKDASVRVSKDRFFELLRGLAGMIIPIKCLAEHTHPIPFPICIADLQGSQKLLLMFDARDSSLLGISVSMGAPILMMVEVMRGVQANEKSTLEDLAHIGISPVKIIEGLKEMIDRNIFMSMLMQTNQPFGVA